MDFTTYLDYIKNTDSMLERKLFSEELLKRAAATPEQIEEARKYGKPFTFIDQETDTKISGYHFDGVSYITDISANKSLQATANSRA